MASTTYDVFSYLKQTLVTLDITGGSSMLSGCLSNALSGSGHREL